MSNRTAIARVEGRGHLRGSLLLTGIIALVCGFMFVAFPGIQAEAEAVQEAFPEPMLELLGIEALDTIEGFLASYPYAFIWVLLAGLYVAYLTAGSVVDDIRKRRMDMTLANPVTRESVVLQKVAGLWLPLLVLNAGLFAVVLVGTVLLGEHVNLVSLVMAHLLSLPYLLVCAGIGMVFSVTLDRTASAQAAAIGGVFVLWLVEAASHLDPDLEWVGLVAPSHYYDPTAILVHEEYALLDAAVLLAAFLGLLAVAIAIFARRDV